VHLELPYPNVMQDLNRWLPLVKWLLAIPHYVVLVVLSLAAVGAVIIAWFAILFTGRYPRGLFDFVEGVVRWHNRVVAYALILVTDQSRPSGCARDHVGVVPAARRDAITGRARVAQQRGRGGRWRLSRIAHSPPVPVTPR